MKLSNMPRVCNPSSLRQDRWTTVPMEMVFANKLPDSVIIDGRWLGYKGKMLGDHTQMWHVRCDVPALGEIGLLGWQPNPSPAHTFVVTPELEALARAATNGLFVVMIVENTYGAPGSTPVLLGQNKVTMQRESPVCLAWHISDSKAGWHQELILRQYSGQDVVDVRGAVTWSDENDPAWKSKDVSISIKAVGELALYFAEKNGFWPGSTDRTEWSLFDGEVTDSVSIPFRGVVFPGIPELEDQGPVDGGLMDWDEFRRGQIEAAKQAPLVAASSWEPANGSWLGMGNVPGDWTRGQPSVDSISYLNEPGGLMDKRPFALALNSGRTGAQEPFGATKDIHLMQGNPWRLYELLYSADDYLLRVGHHRKPDGTRVNRTNSPGWETWMGATEMRAGPNVRGKSRTAEPGWNKMGPRTVTTDDQHRGSHYLEATFAQTGDELLESCLRDMIDVDEARAMPARGWFDAPRAVGRLWQSWANMLVLFSHDRVLKDRIMSMAYDELVYINKMTASMPGEVRPIDVKRDNRVLPEPYLGWVPWNEALCVMGALAMANAIKVAGSKQGMSDEFLQFAIDHGRRIVEHGTCTVDGVVLPLHGVLYDEGKVLPPSYYTLPRAGMENIYVGSAGWWSWWAGALQAATLGKDDHVRERAVAAIEGARYSPYAEWVEWFAAVPNGPSLAPKGSNE